VHRAADIHVTNPSIVHRMAHENMSITYTAKISLSGNKLNISKVLLQEHIIVVVQLATCSPSLAKFADRIDGDTMMSSFENLSTRDASTTGIVAALPLVETAAFENRAQLSLAPQKTF
jgi:hypothetical protein